MILGVAVKFNEITICLAKPARHGNCYNAIVEIIPNVKWSDIENDLVDGFYTDKGEFLDRFQAIKYCDDNNIEHTIQPDLYKPALFSEDLW